MSARYQPGHQVSVRTDSPRHHCRTPSYCRGRTGTIERICGAFRNPEQLAYGGDGLPEHTLYRVRFAQTELWDDYAGHADDVVEIEIFEPWLRPAQAAARG